MMYTTICPTCTCTWLGVDLIIGFDLDLGFDTALEFAVLMLDIVMDIVVDLG